MAINACDAMPEGGKLIVETSNVEVGVVDRQQRPMVALGSYVMLSMADTGIGINKDIETRICSVNGCSVTARKHRSRPQTSTNPEL
jgi:signal transduction histidine kinase